MVFSSPVMLQPAVVEKIDIKCIYIEDATVIFYINLDISEKLLFFKVFFCYIASSREAITRHTGRKFPARSKMTKASPDMMPPPLQLTVSKEKTRHAVWVQLALLQ